MHEIEMVNGQAAMVYSGETPWHGLGTKVDANSTTEQLLKAAYLDWTVDKVPAYIDIDGEKVLTGSQALVRSSDSAILSMVSDNWNPVQNTEAFEFFQEFIDNGDMEMHTAGSLKSGTIVWALAKVKESFELFGGDLVESYLLFTNPHQFGKAIDVRFTPIRVVCNNTLSMALRNNAEHQVSITHRSAFNAEQVKTTLGLAHMRLDEYKEAAEYLGKVRYNAEQMSKYFTKLFPKTNGADGISRLGQEMMDAVEVQPGAKFAEGSFWQLFNAVTYVADHQAATTRDNRLYNAWYGQMRQKKQAALQLAVKMAQTAA